MPTKQTLQTWLIIIVKERTVNNEDNQIESILNYDESDLMKHTDHPNHNKPSNIPTGRII
jgi:hypothetical protein